MSEIFQLNVFNEYIFIFIYIYVLLFIIAINKFVLVLKINFLKIGSFSPILQHFDDERNFQIECALRIIFFIIFFRYLVYHKIMQVFITVELKLEKITKIRPFSIHSSLDSSEESFDLDWNRTRVPTNTRWQR